MDSNKRRELRYQRRKAKRDAKLAERMEKYDNFDLIFTYENLWASYKKCRRGVGWKTSTQKVMNKPITTLATLYNKVHNGTYKSRGFYCFTIIERGKQRDIKSVHITERIVQSCLCDFSIIPMFTASLIYDNGACMKNKGIDFAKDRTNRHLQEYYRSKGDNEGYALVMDYHSFFDLILHEVVRKIVMSYYTDSRIINLFMSFVDMFGDIGLGLGSRISQITAVRYPAAIDTYIKQVLRIRWYARYMDDSYLIHPSKEYLFACKDKIERLCGEYGIELNTKKTQIVKISRGLKFLKQRFILTDTGKVLRIPTKESEKRMRRKLKVFARWIESGKMTIEEGTSSYYAWKSHLLRSNAHYRLCRMDNLFALLINKNLGENQNGSN